MDISTPGCGFLRLTAMGVIGALVKTDNKEAIDTLLRTEIIPLCLGIMENGAETERIVAAFIVLRFLEGVAFPTFVTHQKGSMQLPLPWRKWWTLFVPCSRLLNIVIGCYLRLSDNLTVVFQTPFGQIKVWSIYRCKFNGGSKGRAFASEFARPIEPMKYDCRDHEIRCISLADPLNMSMNDRTCQCLETALQSMDRFTNPCADVS